MKGSKEFAGTLLGFDDYVNMVLEDVIEFDYGTGVEKNRLPKILLNGNNICMVSYFPMWGLGSTWEGLVDRRLMRYIIVDSRWRGPGKGVVMKGNGRRSREGEVLKSGTPSMELRQVRVRESGKLMDSSECYWEATTRSKLTNSRSTRL